MCCENHSVTSHQVPCKTNIAQTFMLLVIWNYYSNFDVNQHRKEYHTEKEIPKELLNFPMRFLKNTCRLQSASADYFRDQILMLCVISHDMTGLNPLPCHLPVRTREVMENLFRQSVPQVLQIQSTNAEHYIVTFGIQLKSSIYLYLKYGKK